MKAITLKEVIIIFILQISLFAILSVLSVNNISQKNYKEIEGVDYSITDKGDTLEIMWNIKIQKHYRK